MESSDRFIRFSLATDAILKSIQKYKNNCLASFGLRSMHLLYLTCLGRAEEGLTPGELADSCGVDKALISRISTELREKGYVEYADPGESNRYRRRITLTQTGRDVMEMVNRLLSEAVERIASGVSGSSSRSFTPFWRCSPKISVRWRTNRRKEKRKP